MFVGDHQCHYGYDRQTDASIQSSHIHHMLENSMSLFRSLCVIDMAREMKSPTSVVTMRVCVSIILPVS